MSAPHCIIEDVTDQPDPTQWDKELGNILIKHGADAGSFLVTILGFLKRKSNFFKEADPKKRVLDAYKQVTGEPDGGIKTGFLASSKPSTTAEKAAPAPPPASSFPAPTPAAPAPSSSDSKPAVAAPADATPSSAASTAPIAAPSPSPADQPGSSGAGKEPEELPDKEEEEEEEEKPKGLKPNAARGADLDHYSWGQTLSECTVNVPVPKGTKAKMMDVVITKSKLRVGIKGQPPIIDGELSESVKPDDCMWNMVDSTVEITLQKADGMHWWNAVVKGDPAIDTQKVEPENSKLTDLDPETRQTVEKMMFDQRQKALGLPTSEELQRQEMLKKFMAAHPEMDFSGAKIM